ncbi:MAG: PT domain-containing protein, partial [Chloroflexota bacterium]|nr:PT domain-containing protein [Chloroflexota bacterium]
LTTVVTVPDGAPVACDFYVIPTESADVPEDLDDSTIELFAFTCAFDAVADPDAADFDDFQTACGDVAPDIDFNLNTGELQFDESTDESGQVAFTYPVGDAVDFFAAVPLEADEYLFCATDGDPAASLIEMNAQGVAEFDNATAEARTCSWFLIENAPATEVPTEAPTTVPTEAPTEVPTEEPTVEPTVEPTAEPTEEPVVPPVDLGEISVMAVSCPVDYDPETQGVDYDALNANCEQGVEDVLFTFGDESGGSDVRVADGQNPLVYSELDPGTYTVYSDVPLEAANEYVFCTADGGNRYQKELNDRGVTTFGELETERIACEWYIVPIGERGDETGGSLEIHLAVCPVGYTGDSIFDDCHGEGLADYEFSLEGPGGTQTATTEIPQTPGPGIVAFTGLAAGDYSFYGGPPGDFGEVELYCSTQPDTGAPDYSIDGALASLTLGENQHVLCDWYFIPEDGFGQTPTPTATPEPERAEILVTLYACPPAASQSGTYGGASLETFDNECTEKVDDVTFRLGDPDSAPLSAKTGASGEGAVRFFDLLPGDLTMTPSLPSNLTSAAVFCTIDDGDIYQKALSNGGTTFVNVNGESIACRWFAVEDREEPAPGPTGSITIREYLCEKDRSEITDWDAECAPGSTGTSYTIANTSGGSPIDGTPGEDGVYVFAGLANGFYTLEQNTGSWCRAVADRVDSESRVIVEGGGNTDVVLYQCNAVEGLPDTGTGPGGTIASDDSPLTGARLLALVLALLAVPLGWAGWLQMRKLRAPMPMQPAEPKGEPRIGANGRVQMRFR